MGWSAGKTAYYGIQQHNGYKRQPAFKHFETDAGYGTHYHDWRVEHRKGRIIKRNHEEIIKRKEKLQNALFQTAEYLRLMGQYHKNVCDMQGVIL